MHLRWLTDFFSYTFREALGVYVIILLVILIRIAPSYLYPGHNADIRIHPENFTDPAVKNHGRTETGEQSVKWKAFDPNTVSAAQLVALGLNDKIARRLVRLRDKGFVFYRPDDMLKVYGMDKAWFGRAAPWIRIGKRPDHEDNGGKAKRREQRQSFSDKEKILVDIATADSFQLTRIPGIGPVLASRIVRYRDLIGGFYSTEQLKEVYGVDDERIQSVERYIHCSPGNVVFLDIQNATYEELSQHPYLGYSGARAITRYRAAHPGILLNSASLSSILALDSVTVTKIRHYLPPYQGL